MNNIDVKWYDPQQRAILCSFTNEWTWHECAEALQMALYMQESHPEPLTYIYDLTESRLSPRQSMTNLQKLLNLEIVPRPYQIIIVEKGVRMQMLIGFIGQAFPYDEHKNLQFVDSLLKVSALLPRP